jgi:hypothetical protein
MSEASTIWFPVFTDVAIKAIALLIIAIVVNRTLIRASAALRCLVWSLAVAGVLALPITCVTFPKCQMLPGWMDLGSIPNHSETGRSPEDALRGPRLRSASQNTEPPHVTRAQATI